MGVEEIGEVGVVEGEGSEVGDEVEDGEDLTDHAEEILVLKYGGFRMGFLGELRGGVRPFGCRRGRGR